MLGRRIDNTARTVIDPDTSIGIDEVGLPIRICKKLLVEETVTAANIKSLTTLLHNSKKEEFPSLVYLTNNMGDCITK